MFEHFDQLWPPIVMDEAAMKKCRSELLAKTKTYLNTMSTHTEIKEAIALMREKHLKISLISSAEWPEESAQLEEEIDMLNEDEIALEDILDEDEIFPIIYSIKIRLLLLTEPQLRIQNDVVVYSREAYLHRLEITTDPVMEIIDTLSTEARYTLAHQLSIAQIEQEDALIFLWEKESHECDKAELASQEGCDLLEEEYSNDLIEFTDDDEDITSQSHYEYLRLKEMHFTILGPQNSPK